jgi:hypothetical protein
LVVKLRNIVIRPGMLTIGAEQPPNPDWSFAFSETLVAPIDGLSVSAVIYMQ